MKCCKGCGVEKELVDFAMDATKKDGRVNKCKVCRNADSAARYAAKHEQITAAKNAYRAANRHLARANTAAWSAANPLRRQATRAAYRARKRGAEGSYKAEDISRLLTLQRGRCAVCAASLKAGYHIDHVQPLALGGSNDRTNLQLLCPPCNLSKGPKDPLVFANARGKLF